MVALVVAPTCWNDEVDFVHRCHTFVGRSEFWLRGNGRKVCRSKKGKSAENSQNE